MSWYDCARCVYLWFKICVYILNQEQAFRATDEFLTTCRDSWTPCGLLGWDSQLFHSFSEFKDLRSSSGWIQKASRSGKEGSWGRDGTRLPSCLHSWWVSIIFKSHIKLYYFFQIFQKSKISLAGIDSWLSLSLWFFHVEVIFYFSFHSWWLVRSQLCTNYISKIVRK